MQRILSLEELGGGVRGEIDRPAYEEKPVDIETFINDPVFLGDVFEEAFYPFWLNFLKELYPSPFYSTQYEVICQLPIGSGKTTVLQRLYCV